MPTNPDPTPSSREVFGAERAERLVRAADGRGGSLISELAHLHELIHELQDRLSALDQALFGGLAHEADDDDEEEE